MAGEKCLQPGCDGTIEQGFCNRCGLEPAGGTAVATGTATPSGRDSALSALSGRSGSTPSRRGSGSMRSSSRKHLGLGLVSVPELPPIAPEQAILTEARLPDHKRFCSNPDCHDAQGNPTPLTRRETGFCPQCGKRYSFVPSLQPGDLAADQYEVKGCLAYGGLGWIYLAKDTLLNRWVVLKGLLNTEDESAAAAAVAERQFLAAVKHPNIVGIYNFVKKGTEGFIVMEYVAGTAVKDLRKQRGPLPAAEAIAYVHRILGAFAYLHNQGLVYCDMKPENFMLEGNPPDVKLIDMGGVRMLNDLKGDIYGTKGYSAPEAAEGPTVASDLYTIGRTLAVLIMDFRFQSSHEFSLPSPAEQPVLAQYESLYRFLLKATAQHPDQRFQSADEMADQLAGVLREIVAETATPRPAESTLFNGDVMTLRGSEEDGVDAVNPALLPDLKIDPDDSAASFILSTAALTQRGNLLSMLNHALPKYPKSVELPLRLVKCLIEAGSLEQAEKRLAEMEAKDPFDWRVPWYRALALLRQGKAKEAEALFDRLYGELPGELAVKLALATAAELAGDPTRAIRMYDIVSRTDPAFTTAAFGLARCLAQLGKRNEAVEAYGRVPPTSSLYVHAQMALARSLMRPTPAPPGVEDLQRAAQTIEGLTLEGRELAHLSAEVLERALSLVGSTQGMTSSSIRLLGRPLEDASLRFGLEDALRQQARFEADRRKRIDLVDRANAMRPRTWI